MTISWTQAEGQNEWASPPWLTASDHTGRGTHHKALIIDHITLLKAAYCKRLSARSQDRVSECQPVGLVGIRVGGFHGDRARDAFSNPTCRRYRRTLAVFHHCATQLTMSRYTMAEATIGTWLGDFLSINQSEPTGWSVTRVTFDVSWLIVWQLLASTVLW